MKYVTGLKRAIISLGNKGQFQVGQTRKLNTKLNRSSVAHACNGYCLKRLRKALNCHQDRQRGGKRRILERLIAGKAILYRKRCVSCGDYYLTANPKEDCPCGRKNGGTVSRVRKLCNVKHTRRYPKWLIKTKAEEQAYRCFWCDQSFGNSILRRNRLIILRPVGDHVEPYSYSYNSIWKNCVASCQICNAFKSSKMFDSNEDCKSYLTKKWDKEINKGIITI